MATQEQIDELKAAYAKGVTEVQMDGERVKFGSRDDMRARIRELEAEVSGRKRTSVLRMMTPRTGRGL